MHRDPLELAYWLTVHMTQGSEFGVTFVVLTNPCWLLSRELLYTALSRLLAHQRGNGLTHLPGGHSVQVQPRNRRIEARTAPNVRRHHRRAELLQ